ncbi:MAG: hypothetical protein FIB01_16135 [Gemmatimonadetes bacterium]|nr:hypothetical protein [Gemmatimonadota bacterium]
MAFPLQVHRINLRYQRDDSEAYQLPLDPEAILTLIVHWESRTPPPGVSPDVVPLHDKLSLGGVPLRVPPRAIWSWPPVRVAKACWHDPACLWHCPVVDPGFVLTGVEFFWGNRDGGGRTVIDPLWADLIVYRNFVQPDLTYRPPERNEHIIPAPELSAVTPGVLEHEPWPGDASAEAEFSWHDPACIWHRPE